MPVDLDIFLSTSPSICGYSTISDCRYSTYEINSRNIVNSQRIEPNNQPFVYHAVANYFQHNVLNHKEEGGKTSREQSVPEDSTNAESKTEKKKRVSFADDKGLALVDVRVITESPEANSARADDFLSMLTCGVKPNVTSEKKWKPTFDHPPYDPKMLASKLEKDMVVLERAILQDDNEDLLTGLIKVKNIAFEKSVFVRATFDRWVSYVDLPATFIKQEEEQVTGLETGSKVDTFKFSLEISSSASRYQVVEFCVGYQCCGKEYWDNNGGINYRLVTASTTHRGSTVAQQLNNGRRHSNIEKPVWARNGYMW